MFGKLGKWLFWGLMLAATGTAALKVGRRAADWVEQENRLLATAGEQTAEALRSMGQAGEAFLSRAGEQQMTILFTGTDDKWSELDSAMLVSIDLEKGSIGVLRLPTDIYVNREGMSSHRLGSIYTAATAKAGSRGDSQVEAIRKGNIALKGFLKENMGIAIDHYISLNRKGLQTIVDSAGGITIELKQAVEYDEGSDLHLSLSAGKHQLSGSQAVDLIRCDGSADLPDPQKLFLSAFFRKIKQDFTLTTAIGLLKAGFSSTVSDLTIADLVPLAKGLLGSSSAGAKMTTLHGTPIVDEAGNDCEVLSRRSTIKLLGTYLSYQSGIDEQHFDRHRVFTSAGEMEAIYYGQ